MCAGVGRTGQRMSAVDQKTKMQNVHELQDVSHASDVASHAVSERVKAKQQSYFFFFFFAFLLFFFFAFFDFFFFFDDFFFLLFFFFFLDFFFFA